jgi:hypothetical protein
MQSLFMDYPIQALRFYPVKPQRPGNSYLNSIFTTCLTQVLLGKSGSTSW